ncbi:hypothetical protein QYF36_007516 [Acer negundo]|nr:hypothetical protein QYF36_007516 [Acer negundo]
MLGFKEAGEGETEGEAEAQDDADILVESDYEQEADDIATETYVDQTKIWDSLNVPNIPHEEYASGYDIEDVSDELKSLDGLDGEEGEQGRVRKFIYRSYHEFHPERDMQDLEFKVGMLFGTADIFRKAIRACAVKHMCDVNFKKNDQHRVRAVCKSEACNWFVYASWLSDHKTFQIKTLCTEHPCATDTIMDASKWQFYRARKTARQMIDSGVKDQYSKLREYVAEVMRMNPDTTIILKCDYSGRFNQWMEKMKTESLLAYNWLAGKDANNWLRAFFKDTVLCDIVCNNMCEVFNAAIIAAQDKPVITMMEMIRNYLMTRLVRKMTELEKLSHQIGPKVFRFVDEIKQESVSNAILSTVETTLTKILCVHGMATVLSTNHDPMDFIYFRPMECPDFRKQRGRPKKKRNFQSDEVRIGNTTKLRRNYIVVTCRKCGKEGHNRATCDKMGEGTDSVATIEGGSQSIGGSQAEHQDGQPWGGKRTRTQK